MFVMSGIEEGGVMCVVFYLYNRECSIIRLKCLNYGKKNTHTQKCILQWIPAHVDLKFTGSYMLQRPIQTDIPTSLADVNTLAKSKLIISSKIKT